MATLTKTASGDLTSFIAGKIYAEIKKYDDEKRVREADPKVKAAAKELEKEDDSLEVVANRDLKGTVKNIFGKSSADVVSLEGKVDDLSAKVTNVASSMVDQQKLIINQHQMLEEKFDIMLSLLGYGGGGVQGIGGGGSAGSAGSGAIGSTRKSTFGQRVMGFFGKALIGKALKWTLKKGLRRMPRSIGRNLLRMRNAPRRLGKKVVRKAVTKFATSGVGKKIATKIGAKTVAKGVGKGIGKSLAKKVPILGAVMGAAFAVDRLRKGDFLGAGLELASGVASIFPGIGTGISVGLDAALIARDVAGGGGQKDQNAVESNTQVAGGSRTISGYEKGSGGTNIMGFFKQAGSLLVSSILPVAAITGTLREVKAQAAASKLDYEVVNVPPPSGVKVGRGKISVSEEDIKVSEIPETSLPEKPVEAPEAPKEGILEKVNNSKPVETVRKVIGSEKGDGFIGPKWLGIKNPFAKDTNENVESKTTVNGGGGPGPIVGRVGTTGKSTGPHIHIEKGDGYTRPKNQEQAHIPQHIFDNIIVGGKPLSQGTSISNPGMRHHPVDKVDKFHAGYDIPYAEGTEIRLTGGLTMVEYDPGENAGFGNALVIQDTSGQKYMIAHLSAGPEEEKPGGGVTGVSLNVSVDPPPIPSLPPVDVTLKSRQILDSSALAESIEEQEPSAPIIMVNSASVTSNPTLIIKASSNSDDFISKYRFMTLGAA